MIAWLLRVIDAARDRGRRRRWQPDQAAGRRGEDLAHRFLERRGFTVVARNYRPPSGSDEIDLVAWDGPALVFVEVKSRDTAAFGSPDRNVDREKRFALERAARDYARRAGVVWDSVRFDLVTVLLRNPPAIDHRRNAFRYN